MKLRLKLPAPRNAWAPLARSRRAGSHRPTGRALRQQGKRATRNELKEMRRPPF